MGGPATTSSWWTRRCVKLRATSTTQPPSRERRDVSDPLRREPLDAHLKHQLLEWVEHLVPLMGEIYMDGASLGLSGELCLGESTTTTPSSSSTGSTGRRPRSRTPVRTRPEQEHGEETSLLSFQWRMRRPALWTMVLKKKKRTMKLVTVIMPLMKEEMNKGRHMEDMMKAFVLFAMMENFLWELVILLQMHFVRITSTIWMFMMRAPCTWIVFSWWSVKFVDKLHWLLRLPREKSHDDYCLCLCTRGSSRGPTNQVQVVQQRQGEHTMWSLALTLVLASCLFSALLDSWSVNTPAPNAGSSSDCKDPTGRSHRGRRQGAADQGQHSLLEDVVL